MNQSRIYAIDTLRAFLMWLGIVFHSTRVYDSKQSWRVSDGNFSIFFDMLGATLHTFRMPAFFLIAGFFCWMGLAKMPASQFLGRQLIRLVVPLLVVALSLNLLQSLFLSSVVSNKSQWSFSTFIGAGEWVSHLWFLIDLVIFYCLAFVLYKLIEGRMTVIKKVLSSLPIKIIFVISILLYPIVVAALFSRLPLLNIYLFKQIPIESILFYFPFFLLGILVNRYPLLYSWFSCRLSQSVVIAAVFAVAHYFLNVSDGGIVFRMLVKWINFFAPIAYTMLLFNLGHRFFNVQSHKVRMFSDASYSVYLLHHLLVIVLAYYLSFLSLPIGLKFLGIVVVVTAITLLIHHKIICRNNLLHSLFNGDRHAINALRRGKFKKVGNS